MIGDKRGIVDQIKDTAPETTKIAVRSVERLRCLLYDPITHGDFEESGYEQTEFAPATSEIINCTCVFSKATGQNPDLSRKAEIPDFTI